MEGISGEAGLAGGPPEALETSAGSTTTTTSRSRATPGLAFSDDVATRFIGYGWNVTRVGDANDLEMVGRAMDVFKRRADRPTLIIVDSHIGYGSPHKQDTVAAHGEPSGEEEIRLTKRFYGWPEDGSSSCPTRSVRTFAGGNRDEACRSASGRKVRAYRPSIRILPRSSTESSGANCPRAGTRTFRASRPTQRGSPAEASGMVLNAIAEERPVAHGWIADLGVDQE